MSYDNEIWQTIKNFPKYSISTCGRVKNIITNKIIKHSINNTGYYLINLYNDIIHRSYTVHRLVALHFISNPNNYKVVDHRDRNKFNNNVENLRWVTYSQNGLNVNIKGNIYKYIDRNRTKPWSVRFRKYDKESKVVVTLHKTFKTEQEAREQLSQWIIEYPRNF